MSDRCELHALQEHDLIVLSRRLAAAMAARDECTCDACQNKPIPYTITVPDIRDLPAAEVR